MSVALLRERKGEGEGISKKIPTIWEPQLYLWVDAAISEFQ